MQLLVLQGENKPVSTFIKQQYLTDSGLIVFIVRERIVYIHAQVDTSSVSLYSTHT